jgi:molybdopterin/thiamine biosynthesis adenylyltransferase
MSIDSRFSHCAAIEPSDAALELVAPGFPPPAHIAEADLFARQTAMAGHDQKRLEAAHIAVIGCGGLGSWIALGLARMGVRELTLVDPDRFDRTNAPRQLVCSGDLGQPKAHAVARNVLIHMTNLGRVRGLALSLDEASNRLDPSVSGIVVGVDNNGARLAASSLGLRRQIPVVFTMLSRDGLRAQIFLQRLGGPCLSCVLPNLDAESSAPCAAASIASCGLAAAHAVHLVAAGVMGLASVPTWRETSLDGSTERASNPNRRLGCQQCGGQ